MLFYKHHLLWVWRLFNYDIEQTKDTKYLTPFFPFSIKASKCSLIYTATLYKQLLMDFLLQTSTFAALVLLHGKELQKQAVLT